MDENFFHHTMYPTVMSSRAERTASGQSFFATIRELLPTERDRQQLDAFLEHLFNEVKFHETVTGIIFDEMIDSLDEIIRRGPGNGDTEINKIHELIEDNFDVLEEQEIRMINENAPDHSFAEYFKDDAMLTETRGKLWNVRTEAIDNVKSIVHRTANIQLGDGQAVNDVCNDFRDKIILAVIMFEQRLADHADTTFENTNIISAAFPPRHVAFIFNTAAGPSAGWFMHRYGRTISNLKEVRRRVAEL